jgi:hypothetical protein
MSDQLPAANRGRPKGSGHALTGLYVKSPKGLKLRDRSVQRIVAQMRELCDWIEPCDLPLLRRWAELEIHASRVHGFLKLIGDVNSQGEPRRLLDELRKIALAQAAIGSQLGFSPASRTGLRQPGGRTERDVTDTVANRVVEIGKGRAQSGGGAADDGTRGRE